MEEKYGHVGIKTKKQLKDTPGRKMQAHFLFMLLGCPTEKYISPESYLLSIIRIKKAVPDPIMVEIF